MSKIIVVVDGGVVQGVWTNIPIGDASITVFDRDNLKAENKTEEEISKEWETVSKGTYQDW